MQIHSNARTNIQQRQHLRQSTPSCRALASRYHVAVGTVHRWQHRETPEDRSTRPHTVHTAFTEEEAALLLRLRRHGLSLDAVLDAVAGVLPEAGRASVHRLFVRHGVQRRTKARPPVGTFKPYAPGFVHIDCLHLPRLEGPHAYCYVAIDRATEIKQDGDAAVFLRTGPGTYALRTSTSGNELPGSPVSSAASSPVETPVEALSFNDAAALILEQYAHGQPLHYVAITEQALALGLIQTKGQTPTATMNAQLTTEIRRAMQRGEVPRFVAHGKGWYGLSAWVPQGVAGEIAQHNANVRQQLRQRLLAMGGSAFEQLVGDLLHAVGFEDVVVTATSGDGGVDVRGTLVDCGGMIRTRYAVQAKCWQANIHAPEIQNLRGSLAADEHGLFVTTSEYSAGAYAEATALGKKPIALINGKQLISLLIEQHVGVTNTAFHVLALKDSPGKTDATA